MESVLPKKRFRDLLVLMALIELGLNSVHGFNLTIITVIIGKNPSYGYQATAPVFDVVLAEMKIKYPSLFDNVSYHLVYYPGTYSCPDGGELVGLVAPTKVWDIVNHYTGNFIALFCPGCSRDLIPLGDFAREWNIPLFASVASSPLLGNKNRYPTVTTFPGSDDTSLPAAIKMFLDIYTWRTVTVVCDFSMQYQNLYTSYTLSYENVRKKLTEVKGMYNTRSYTFDSSETQDYTAILRRFRTFCRVILIFASPRILRDLMVAAYWLNMTNGDYIFLSVQTTKIPYFGNLTWQYNDENDKFAFEAFQTLITIANPDPVWEKFDAFITEYATVSENVYNNTITEDAKLNDRVISTYECFEAFAMVLNESQQTANKETADTFAKRFWNRNYTFNSRQFYISSDGIRINSVEFVRLNISSGKMEKTWHFNALTSELYDVSKLSAFWKGRNQPPDDRFICGFYNELCIDITHQTSIGASCAAGCILVVICAGCFYVRNIRAKETKLLWWSLDPLRMKQVAGKTSTSFLSCSEFGKNDLPQNISTYNGHPVWISAFTPAFSVEQLQAITTVRHILSAIRALRNDNIAQFIGIIPTAKETHILFACGDRGSLRQLLDNQQLAFDGPVQSSSVWDILSGLEYIHSTPLHVHGSVSSLAATVDRRFCVRLCDYATAKLLVLLTKHNVPSCSDHDFKLLWKAPEILADDTLSPTQKADVYSLGIVLAEIFTRNCPVGLISFNNEFDIQDCIQNLRIEGGPRIVIDSQISSPIKAIIKDCLQASPQLRPTLRQLTSKTAEHLTRENMINSIMSRLQQYANDLEKSVEARTAELLEERQKVDTLLAEIIPRTFVHRLRNKEVVKAEHFDSVTLMFTKFPEFATVALRTSPLDMISILGQIYSTFDACLARFDVYKVETISDSYLIASGLPTRNGNRHAGEIARAALALQHANNDLAYSALADNEKYLHLRVGFHSGLCAAGIVGLRMPRYCLFGDTVNTASRMESHGDVSRIHLSYTSKTLLALDENVLVQLRGDIFIKGKGLMETYWLLGSRE